jgi:hypothetical protein
MEPSMNESERRITSLEKSVGMQRLVIAGLILAVLAVTLTESSLDKDATFDSLATQQLLIADEAGLPMLLLGSNEFGGVVVVLNATGEVKMALLGSNELGGHFELSNPEGARMSGMGVDEDGGVVEVMNTESRTQVTLGSHGYGGAVAVFNSVGLPRGSFISDANSSGRIDLLNEAGEPALQAFVDANSNGAVGTYDYNGKDRTPQPGQQ